MQEHDITLSSNPMVLRWVEFAGIQANAFSLLFSPSALQRPSEQRIANATSLVLELQTLVDETSNAQNASTFHFPVPCGLRFLYCLILIQKEIQHLTPSQLDSDSMGRVYLEAEQVVQLTILALISRVAPLPIYLKLRTGHLTSHRRCSSTGTRCVIYSDTRV